MSFNTQSFNIENYLKFLDSVIDECGPVPALTPASNAVTRRAKNSYLAERKALSSLAARYRITDVQDSVFDRLWPNLCKREKYGLLCPNYDKPKESTHDMRWPQDGRLVPVYAKDALAQLRTIAACVLAVIQDKKDPA